MILGPVVSGLALALALGAWVERWWPRAAAGLLYGFSPFVVAHSSVGHLNLVWAVLPPALLWLLHALLVAPAPAAVADRRAHRAGVRLQTGIYTQTVALCAVLLVVLALMLAVRWPREAVRRAPDVLRAAAACLGTYAVLCAYPLYLLLAGPGRPRSEIREPETTNSDAANLLRPHAPDAVPDAARTARRAAAHPLRRAGRLRRARAARGGRRRGGDGPAPAHPGRRGRRGGRLGALARGEPRRCSAATRASRCPGAWSRASLWSARSRRCGSRWWSRCASRSSSRCGSTTLADLRAGGLRTLALAATGVAMLTWLPGERAGRDARGRPRLLRRRRTRPDEGGRRRDLPALHRRLGGRGAADAVAGRERVRLPDHRRVLHRVGRAARPAARVAGHRVPAGRGRRRRRRPPPSADAAPRRATSCARWG